MTWAIWLLVPAAVTGCAALGSWLRSRPARPMSTSEAMQAHDDFLAALVQPARARERGSFRD